jgi:hypothetical protein
MIKTNALLASALLLGTFSINANATLTTVDNGLGVYDSTLNVTWTSNANLLGTMEQNAISQYGNDSSVINAIITASPVINDPLDILFTGGTGKYNVSASDFGSGGSVSWFGAEAFVSYLNSIDYGNSNQWVLPATIPPSNPPAPTFSQLSELFYELGGTAGNSFPANSYFTNEQVSTYWSTEASSDPSSAWFFGNGSLGAFSKNVQFYAWAVSSGQLGQPIGGSYLIAAKSAIFVRRKIIVQYNQ